MLDFAVRVGVVRKFLARQMTEVACLGHSLFQGTFHAKNRFYLKPGSQMVEISQLDSRVRRSDTAVGMSEGIGMRMLFGRLRRSAHMSYWRVAFHEQA